jgi:D-alanyl-D-alanine-carboxypeptidase/D-alanyl-D-alanine-endopeptidase
MADTVFNPRPGDEKRLMQGHNFDGTPLPFVPTPVTMECASGLYTTPNDMLKWIAWHLAQGGPEDDARRIIDHASLVRRDGLSPVLGLDDGGAPMDAMGLGWVMIEADGDHPLILHKSGGRQGMFTYVAIAPTRRIGVFVAINQFSAGGFASMVKQANELVSQLAPR